MGRKFSATKSFYLKVGSNIYRLVPATAQTHYGQHHLHSGGIPYAFQSKKARDAWLVVSDWNGQTLGIVESNGEWSFQKVTGHESAPAWLRSQMFSSIGWTIYNLSTRVYSDATAEAAISKGLGVRMQKSEADLKREIDDFREKSWGGK